MVTLTYGGWDMHNQITPGMRSQMPAFDQALSTLIRDLDQRGLLAKTLVMVSSEFGRTPKINQNAGRDHWPKVFSVLLAGGGVKGGMIYGSSNATASEPETDPVSPEDLATTMYNQLGIMADSELMAPGDRPIEIVKGGKVLTTLGCLTPFTECVAPPDNGPAEHAVAGCPPGRLGRRVRVRLSRPYRSFVWLPERFSCVASNACVRPCCSPGVGL